MEKKLDELRKMAMGGEIFGITIDTCIFDEHQVNLDAAWFQRLNQFSTGLPPSIYFPQVVKDEVICHIAEKALIAKQALNRASKDIRKYWDADFDFDLELFKKGGSEIASARFEVFRKKIGANILSTTKNVDTIFDLYFSQNPPFGKTESKKAEFPDAFALLTISEYCLKHDKIFLVISKDKGWLEFCKSHSHLVCIENLGAAISLFQAEAALSAERYLNRDIVKPEYFALEQQLESSFRKSIEGFDYKLVAESNHSSLRLDSRFYEVSVTSIERIDEDGGVFSAYDVVDDDYTFKFSSMVNLDVTFDVSFYGWDDVDRKEVLVGSRLVTFSQSQRLDALVTLKMPHLVHTLPVKTEVIDLECDDLKIVIQGGEIDTPFGDDDNF
jgi:hypothetical protein